MRRQPVGPPIQDTGVITRLARHRDGRPRPGDDHAVGGNRIARLQRDLPPIAVGDLQAGHDTGDNLRLRHFGDFAQVGAPLAVRRPHPTAVNPVAVDAVPYQVALPAVLRHRRDHVGGCIAPVRSVRITDVLFRRRPQRQQTIGVSLAPAPIPSDLATVNQHNRAAPAIRQRRARGP